MARKFLHIGFTFAGPPRMKDLEPVFTASGDDWIRYSAASWIVWTEKSATDWYMIVKPHIAPFEYILITGMDMNERMGWQPQSVWDWIDARRGVTRNYLAEILRQLPPPSGDTGGGFGGSGTGGFSGP
jgi:hypothetical protein